MNKQQQIELLISNSRGVLRLVQIVELVDLSRDVVQKLEGVFEDELFT